MTRDCSDWICACGKPILAKFQWNPALLPPRQYGHLFVTAALFWPKQKLCRLITHLKNLSNTARFLGPVGDWIELYNNNFPEPQKTSSQLSLPPARSATLILAPGLKSVLLPKESTTLLIFTVSQLKGEPLEFDVWKWRRDLILQIVRPSLDLITPSCKLGSV